MPHQGNLTTYNRQDHYRKPQPIQMQSCGAQSQLKHLQNTPAPKAQGTLKKRRRKDDKSLVYFLVKDGEQSALSGGNVGAGV